MFLTLASSFYILQGISVLQDRWLKVFSIPQQGGALMTRRNKGTISHGTEQIRKPKGYQDVTASKEWCLKLPLVAQQVGRQVVWGPLKP